MTFGTFFKASSATRSTIVGKNLRILLLVWFRIPLDK